MAGKRTETVTVLVIAQTDDRMVDAVVSDLADLAVPVFRADTSWFPRQLGLHAQHRYGRWIGELRTEHRHVRLEDIRSVWYRSPSAFRFDPEMNDVERAFAHREARMGFGGLLAALPDVLWMNDPNRTADAMYKPLQLQVAGDCGLRVPRTVLTNDAATIRRFAAESKDGVVLKTLGANTVTEGGELKVVFTRRLTDADLADLRGAEATAVQVQDWIPKEREMRVVAVGDTLFPIAIHAHSAASRVDWRADYDALSYQRSQLPDVVADGLRGYLCTLGLSFACFDLVIDPDGAHWFLEANTAGQYGWLEAHTDAPITQAVAGLLAQGKAA